MGRGLGRSPPRAHPRAAPWTVSRCCGLGRSSVSVRATRRGWQLSSPEPLSAQCGVPRRVDPSRKGASPSRTPGPKDGGPAPSPQSRGQRGGRGCSDKPLAPSDVPTERVRLGHPGSLVFPWPPSARGQCPGLRCPPSRPRRGLVPHPSSPGEGGPCQQPRFCPMTAVDRDSAASPFFSVLRPRRGGSARPCRCAGRAVRAA